jgi:hypothetical protein
MKGRLSAAAGAGIDQTGNLQWAHGKGISRPRVLLFPIFRMKRGCACWPEAYRKKQLPGAGRVGGFVCNEV